MLKIMTLLFCLLSNGFTNTGFFDGLESDSTNGDGFFSGIVTKVKNKKAELMTTSSEEYGRYATSGDLKPRESFHIIKMPDMHAQKEYNTCGTHNMARYLKHIGFSIKWDDFYNKATERSFFKPIATTDVTGTMPSGAQKFLKQYNSNFTLKEGASYNDILLNLQKNRPVMVLIRVGSTVKGAVPAMHWIMLIGYDTKKRTWYFYDTNGNNIYQTSWDLLRRNHYFENNYKALDFTIQHLAQVKGGSIIYCGPNDLTKNGTCNLETMR